MSTLEFVSASADGLSDGGAPLVTAPTLVTGLGTHPAITVPLVCGREPDTGSIWRRLAEPAEFYGTEIPDEGALQRALDGYLDAAEARHGPLTLAADVMVVQVRGRTQFVVSATPIQPVRPDPVLLTTRPCVPGPVPYWRQMAARTSSRAEADLLQRELNTAGFADVAGVDGNRIGVAALGALVFDTADGPVGTGVERLALLQEAGLLDAVAGSDDPVDVSGVTRVRWVSPRFETHPVSAIGPHRFGSVGAGR
jgi:hypothetical protein